MEKEKEKTYNGSYLYRLNEELSGQQELAPYFVTSVTGEENVQEQTGLADNVGDDEEVH